MGLMKLLSRPKSDGPTDVPGRSLCDDPCADHLLRTGSYCKLLADTGQWQNDAVAAAAELMQQEMAFVPGGTTRLLNIAVDQAEDDPGSVEVFEEPFFIDRHAVTNSQFQRFVDADGYRDESFWPVEIQPYIFQFVDATRTPGPAIWQDGAYDPAKKHHPVVGISWHEANAYANWIGKFLPTSSQWQQAATWWEPNVKYTWGNAYENDRTNIYLAGVGDTVEVARYLNAATPNGVVQLVGNVWEWVDGCFVEVEFCGRMAQIDEPLGEIRGGAFDTYLVSQASCLFRSGQALLKRSHNVGFRCAASAQLLADE